LLAIAERVEAIRQGISGIQVGGHKPFTMAGTHADGAHARLHGDYHYDMAQLHDALRSAEAAITLAVSTYGKAESEVRASIKRLESPQSDPRKQGPGGIEKLLP
jgi:hypothetical protein